MCIFGLYEKIIDSILHFFSDIKKNLKFILPIACGALIGVFIFGNILKILFVQFYMPTCFAFIGLILGSLKLVIKQTDITKANIFHIITCLITFSFSIYLFMLEGSVDITYNTNSNIYLIIAGVLMSAGIVVPGISKTVILMMLGIYPMYISAIANFDISFLLPIGIGLLIGGVIFLFIINFLFKYVKSYTYFGIIGFVIASVFILYPGFAFDIQGFISLLLLILFFIIGLNLSNLENKI